MSNIIGVAEMIRTAKRLAVQAQTEGLLPHHHKVIIMAGNWAHERNCSGFSSGIVLGYTPSQNKQVHLLRTGINHLPGDVEIPIRKGPDLLCRTCTIRAGSKFFNPKHLNPYQKPCDPGGLLIAREDSEALDFIRMTTGRTDVVRVGILKRLPRVPRQRVKRK